MSARIPRSSLPALLIRFLLMIVVLGGTEIVFTASSYGQREKVKRGAKGPISKENLLFELQNRRAVKGYIVKGEDIIQLLRGTIQEIRIEKCVIEGGLDFTKLPATPLEEAMLLEDWDDEERQKWVKRNRSKGLKEVYVLKSKLILIDTDVLSARQYGKNAPPFVVSAEGTVFRSANFSGSTFGGEADFSGTIFTEGADFSGTTFRRGTDFSRAAFSRGANFSGSVFKGKVGFSDALFKEKADFLNATFSGGVNFDDAAFRGTASFSYVVFKGEADFSRATFMGSADFSDAAFKGRGSFSYAIFRGETLFSQAAFSGRADFSKATFSGSVRFPYALFRGRADFSNTAFGGRAGFSGAVFSKRANFLNVTFRSEANFLLAVFSGVTDFSKASFGGRANFFRTTFKGKTYFLETGFNQLAFFKEARFLYSLALRSSRFMAYADFRDTKITRLDFNSAASPVIIDGRFDFRNASIFNAHFQDIVFVKDVDFSDAKFGHLVYPDFTTVFRYVTFEADAYFLRTAFSSRTSFEKVNFKKDADFTDAWFSEGRHDGKPVLSLSYVNFDHLQIRWNQLPDLESWVTGSEDRIKSFLDSPTKTSSGTPELLSLVFKRLEASFRRGGQLREANESYYRMKLSGLEEARDVTAYWHRLFREAEWIVWGIPFGYGTRPWRGLGFSLLIVLLYSSIYNLVGNLRMGHERTLRTRFRDFPRDYIAENEPFEPTSEAAKQEDITVRPGEVSRTQGKPVREFLIKFANSLHLSFAILFRISFRDPKVSNMKVVVLTEWVLGYLIMVGLAVTLSNTWPLLNRIRSFLF